MYLTCFLPTEVLTFDSKPVRNFISMDFWRTPSLSPSAAERIIYNWHRIYLSFWKGEPSSRTRFLKYCGRLNGSGWIWYFCFHQAAFKRLTRSPKSYIAKWGFWVSHLDVDICETLIKSPCGSKVQQCHLCDPVNNVSIVNHGSSYHSNSSIWPTDRLTLCVWGS